MSKNVFFYPIFVLILQQGIRAQFCYVFYKSLEGKKKKNVNVLPKKHLSIVCNILPEKYFHMCIGNSFQIKSVSLRVDESHSQNCWQLSVHFQRRIQTL